MTDTTKRRGRPPLAWLTAKGLQAVPPGTALKIERHGRKGPLLVARLVTATDDEITVRTADGELVTIGAIRFKRARIVAALFEPGDALLKRGVSADRWRGGVVRCVGEQVLVEQIDGTVVWLAEDEVEPPEARDVPLPARRGPVPRVG